MTEAETTRFCARIIGPLMLLVGAVVIARMDALPLIIPAILQDGPLAFITGMFTLICGLVLIAAHHHWSSAAAIAVTILAVLTIIRGLTLMFAPGMLAGLANTFLVLGPGVLIAGGVALAIGAWLTLVGWFAKRPAQG